MGEQQEDWDLMSDLVGWDGRWSLCCLVVERNLGRGTFKNSLKDMSCLGEMLECECKSRNLKGGIGSLFDPCVNVVERRPYCPSHMEVSYWIFRFEAIIRLDLRTLSSLCDSWCDNQFACMIWVHAKKATHA